MHAWRSRSCFVAWTLDNLQTLEQEELEEAHILSSRIGLRDGVSLVATTPRRTL